MKPNAASLANLKPFRDAPAPVVDTTPDTGLLLGSLIRQSVAMPFWDWALKVPEPKAGRLDFERFPFQIELYKEGAGDKEMVVRKATQVGVSAYLLRWAIYWCDQRPLNSLYVFPKARQMYDFSTARVDEAIRGSKYLRGRLQTIRDEFGKRADNMGQKKLGHGYIYFRGSDSKTQLDSVDADVLALDEYDTLTQQNIPDAEMRISNSDVGLIRRVGVPSYPGFGIAKMYAESDQRVWMVKCDGCGEWQQVLFHENFDADTLTRVCRDADCRRPLNVLHGEWVAQFPDRDIRGYHMSRLIVGHTDLAFLKRASEKTKPFEVQVFYNKYLGLEYAPEEGRLSDAAYEAAQSKGNYSLPAARGGRLVTMGVDVASVRNLNVRISEHLDDRTKRALFIGEVESFRRLEQLMEQFDVNMATIDHLPEGRIARGFAEKFPGRVYLVAYDSSNAAKPEVLRVNEEMRFATVRRLEALDATLDMIRQERNLLPWNAPEGHKTHLQALVRLREDDEFGKVVVRYQSMGADDYAHAECYDLVATELWWYRQGVDAAARETLQPLDNMLEFERAELGGGEADDLGYYPGPDLGDDDEDYHAGPSFYEE